MVLGEASDGKLEGCDMSIKQPRDELLEGFQERDHCCRRQELHEEDVCLMYTFDQTTGGMTLGCSGFGSLTWMKE